MLVQVAMGINYQKLNLVFRYLIDYSYIASNINTPTRCILAMKRMIVQLRRKRILHEDFQSLEKFLLDFSRQFPVLLLKLLVVFDVYSRHVNSQWTTHSNS